MASLLKQLIALAVIAGAAAWLILAQTDGEMAGDGPGRERPPAAVEVEAARAGVVERVVSAVGSGRALRSVELRFSDSGRVTEILFGDGDRVEAGATLARLDAAVQRAAVDEARADLEEAEAAFERSRSLREQGRIADAAFDTAQSVMLRARARLDRALADLDRRELRAPFPGVIGFSELERGAVVGPDTAVATLDDISTLDVQFSVPERFFGEVQVGEPVRASTRVFPDEVFEGEVRAIDRRVDEVSRSFRVRARVPNPGLRLPAGVFIQAELVLDSREGVLAPEESLISEAGETHLFVVTDEDRVEKRAVTIGGRRAGEAEVIEGLAAGERVVTRGVQKVRDGAPVRVIGEEEEAPATAGQTGDGAARGQTRSAG
ncbi:MAG: efflux RND transporter periplasmic adaptor subunit [Pseudomonadota bacterium]